MTPKTYYFNEASKDAPGQEFLEQSYTAYRQIRSIRSKSFASGDI